MNILQIISSSRTSGAEKHVIVLSQWLQKRGHTLTAVCPNGGWLPEQLRLAGIPTIELPMKGKASLRSIKIMAKFVRDNNIDLVHTHLTRATYIGYIVGRITKRPVVSTVHVLTKDAAYRYLPGKNKHFVVTVSNFVRQALVDRGVSPDKMFTVYNGTEFDGSIPQSESTREEVRAELGIPLDSTVIGQLGRVDDFKGAHLTVAAVKSVVQENPDSYFVLIGFSEPEYAEKLRAIASKDGVGDRLVQLGVRNDVSRLMSALDIVTLPSVTEACSMAIIEAMSSGKPVIATNAGGNPELVDHEKTGLLVERNVESLAAAINKLAGNKGLRQSMGKLASERARNQFYAPIMAQNMENLYNSILSKVR